MRVITLTISHLDTSGTFRLSLDGDGEGGFVDVHEPPATVVDRLRLEPSGLEELLAPTLVRRLRQWSVKESVTSVLAVASEVEALDGVPWELLPQVLNLHSLCVVRQVQGKPVSRPRWANAAPVLLAAGWSGKPTFQLPGIMEELRAIGELWAAAGPRAHVLLDPTLDELGSACTSYRPDILHLVPPAVDTHAEQPRVALSGVDEIQMVDASAFLSALPDDLRPQLVIVNTCSSGAGAQGPSLTRMITERFGTIAVGWLGTILDMAAADFSRFLHSRLLEGLRFSDVMRAYALIHSGRRHVEQPARDLVAADEVAHYTAVPVIWTPAVDAVARPVVLLDDVEADEVLEFLPRGSAERGLDETEPRGPQPADRGDAGAEAPTTLAGASPRLELEFKPQSWLNPALLKNGQPAITRLVLTPDRSMRGVELAVTCDTGNGVSAVRQTIDLDRGPQPVRMEERQFPVLYALIEEGVPRRQVNFTVTCRWEGRLLAEQTVAVLWMGRAEWLDRKDTWHYVPAFVNPYDDGVLAVIDKSDPILKTIAGPKCSFSGYQTGDVNHVSRQVEALFNCLRDHYALNYITPPPVNVFLPGSLQFQSSGQRVRLPEEVIERKRGTCHDLSVLLAGCMEHIGIHPIVILVRNHTFVGYWRDNRTHGRFWKDARNQQLRLPQIPGREWIMTELSEVQGLLKADSIVSVEATQVTNRNATFEEAIAAGAEHWGAQRLAVRPFDVAVDIRASRHLVQPL